MKQKNGEFFSVIHLVTLRSTFAVGLISPIPLTTQLCGMCLVLIAVHIFLRYDILVGKYLEQVRALRFLKDLGMVSRHFEK